MSRRRRTRLQRLKQSVVVTFSAAAAGSAGCDALADPSMDDGSPGRPAVGPVAGGVPVPPFLMPVTNPPLVNPTVMQPCPSAAPVAGTPCTTTGQACTYPVVGTPCPFMQTSAQCMVNAWVVSTVFTGSCNPPWTQPDAGTPDAGTVDEDAGLDDDGGLDVDI